MARYGNRGCRAPKGRLPTRLGSPSRRRPSSGPATTRRLPGYRPHPPRQVSQSRHNIDQCRFTWHSAGRHPCMRSTTGAAGAVANVQLRAAGARARTGTRWQAQPKHLGSWRTGQPRRAGLSSQSHPESSRQLSPSASPRDAGVGLPCAPSSRPLLRLQPLACPRSTLTTLEPHPGHERPDRTGQQGSSPAHHLASSPGTPHQPQVAAVLLGSLTQKRSRRLVRRAVPGPRWGREPRTIGDQGSATDNSGRQAPRSEPMWPDRRRSSGRPSGSLITGAIKWGDVIFASVQVRHLRGHTL